MSKKKVLKIRLLKLRDGVEVKYYQRRAFQATDIVKNILFQIKIKIKIFSQWNASIITNSKILVIKLIALSKIKEINL